MKRRISYVLLAGTMAAAMVLTACGQGSTGVETGTGSESESGTEASTNNVPGSEEETAQSGGSTDGSATIDVSSVTYGQLAMGGGGFVAALAAHPNNADVVYARTDVGGAYRYNTETKLWESISLWTSEADKGLLSIDGIALDPNDDQMVYMAAGCSYFSDGKTAILYSADQGQTWTQTDVSDLIRVHGNGMGRQNGERIAVDPQDGNNILVGGRTGGLILSTDQGKSFAKVEGFPITETDNDTGIVSIVYDGEGKVYVGVSESGSANVYVADVADLEHWDTIDALPSKLMPERIRLASDGTLVITYADESGPWDSGSGAVWTYDPATDTAQDISPNNRPYGDVAIDPQDPDRMVAVTINTWVQQTNGAYGDQFFTTTDGGENWTEITSSITIDTNNCPWIDGYAIHWCGCLMMNPTDSNSLMVTSGNGIFACDNIWDEAPTFYFNAHGLEETVPLDIMSIPDGPLVTAVGDYDGCMYDDTYAYGEIHTVTVGTTTGIAFGGEDNSVWMKVGNNDSQVTCYVSTDSGKTWTVTSKIDCSGKTAAGGKCSVSADGKTIFYSPENSAHTYYSEDLGKTWIECKGLVGKMHIVCDTVNKDYVYAAGIGFYVSTDGGKTFERSRLSNNDITRFCQPYGQEGEIWLPLGATYVYSTDHGQTWSDAPDSIINCRSIGVGAAATEDGPYVVYMYGDAGEGMGIYASEDNGVNWTRVNDDAHQFGGYGNGNFVIGDMNEYGKYYFGTVGLGVCYGKYETK